MSSTIKKWNWAALWRWSLFAWLVVALDQATKYWFQHHMSYGQVDRITDFFNLVLTYNSGAAFSFLANAGGWQRIFFSALSVIAVVAISLMIARQSQRKLLCFGLALVLGGAVGNAYDRIVLGYVVDFLDFHIGIHHWPAFNVADSAICIGAAIIIAAEFLFPHHAPQEKQ